jgi:hypothetical protein
MNTDELVREIRVTLQQNVRDITEASLTRPDLAATPRSRIFHAGRWVAPTLAAAVIVVIAGIMVSLSAHRHGDSAATGTSGALSGAWELVGANAGGRPVTVSSKWVVRLVVHSDNTILINDGVNATALTGHGADGVLRATFRSITFALDPRQGTAQGRALLQLLDSIAPNTKPRTQASSRFEIADGELTIHTSIGDLVFRQAELAPADSPSTTVSTTSS